MKSNEIAKNILGAVKVLKPKKLSQHEFLDGIEKTTKEFLNEPSDIFFNRYSEHSAQLSRVPEGSEVVTDEETNLKSLIGDICKAITDEYLDPIKGVKSTLDCIRRKE